MKSIVFFDLEVSQKGDIQDIGAITLNDLSFHDVSVNQFMKFIQGYEFLCGHNILIHDLKYLPQMNLSKMIPIDTLYLSPLLFPKKPYHNLLKDDKFNIDELNNPLNDSKKARELFSDEIQNFHKLDDALKEIYYQLLNDKSEFSGFFQYIEYRPFINRDLKLLIQEYFKDYICHNANIEDLIKYNPIELAYALAVISHLGDSITPRWVLMSYPEVENILHALRNNPCYPACLYCSKKIDEISALKEFFGYDHYREFNGVPLQQNTVKAAILNKSLLAIFPTGGGKSLTFQIPALIAGRNESGLTVVISPLQSLMKDQVDSLENKGIVQAVTINGSLDPVERSKAIERIEDGSAWILYISPESLRSKTIETLLLKRNVVRFVIDEAHCFSSWGQDFRVDYLYIGDFIKQLQEKKINKKKIPISCFTATAKPKVVEDIQSYFKEKLSIELQLFLASSERKNLQYHVVMRNNDQEKYENLRNLLTNNIKPTIIYVSRTRDCEKISNRLNGEGYSSTFYHGKLDREVRIANQNAFMNDEVQIIVATTAFGMGVDKSDVTTVIHYDISDSLESYVQEAGRAGRNENLKADCYVLYNEEDLNKHFQLLNQSKLSIKEIQQVWKAIKDLTKVRKTTIHSALEIARQAGWEEGSHNLETRITTAINALEETGFVKRMQNHPRIFADSLTVKSVIEANEKIDASELFDDKTNAKRVIKCLVSAKHTSNNDEGEGRIDYIADRLGIPIEEVTSIVLRLKEIGILQSFKDIHAFLKKSDTKAKFNDYLKKYIIIEEYLLKTVTQSKTLFNLKKMNEDLAAHEPKISVKDIKQLLNYLDIMKVLSKKLTENKNCYYLYWNDTIDALQDKFEKRKALSVSVIEYFQSHVLRSSTDEIQVDFSLEDIKQNFEYNLINGHVDHRTVESTLYYLKKIGCLRIEGAFLVTYNAMQIERISDRLHYNKEDYRKLEEFYKNKMEQIHIVGEYATKMMSNVQDALIFVNDYFSMNYQFFIQKYFGGRESDLKLKLTPKKNMELFGDLSPSQKAIIDDKTSNHIVVAAGPGSGKTKLLVHKLASLVLTEDVKQEQLLMLTFSKAAAMEFKKRLIDLIGTPAHYIQITTFHSYCFDLLEKIGSLDKSENVVSDAVQKIQNGDVDKSRITKTTLVIDEAQDMSKDEFALVETLMEENEGLRVIAVGDDDQNIYEFRGSSSEHLHTLVNTYQAKQYELSENYRSQKNIVEFSNQFISRINNRLKRYPVVAKSQSLGYIKLYKYKDTSILVPVVQKTLNENICGTVGVLTKKNEDALNLNTLFNKRGIPSRIIQSNTDFNLWNLVEIRYFDSLLTKTDKGLIIEESMWDNAVSSLKEQYRQSTNLPFVLKLLNNFKKLNKCLFYSDFKQTISEFEQKDLYETNSKEVTVSTIHQAKGREFDNVILVINKNDKLTDEDIRLFYVAITRAKKNLFIHAVGTYFDSIKVSSIGIYPDATKYDDPNEIAYSFTHKDIALGYCEFTSRTIDKLYSGMTMIPTDVGCSIRDGDFDKPILKYSKSFLNRLGDYEQKGYKPVDAIVNNIVFWFNKEKEKEIKIVLPTIRFTKEKSSQNNKVVINKIID